MINHLYSPGITGDDAAPGPRSSWRERAACQGASTDLFFPVGTAGAAAAEGEQARQICAGCAVRPECLGYALATGQQYGIWGGHDEEERRLLRRRVALLRSRRLAAASESRGHPPVRLDGS